MTRLNLNGKAGGALRVLCLGCHSDDIEIGCGGTILRLAEENPDCLFQWAVFSAIGEREGEARRAADLFAGGKAFAEPILMAFPDTFMPFVGADVKRAFESLKTFSPDVVFTHNRKDAHQDHRLVAELTWNAFRDHFILEYEIPKYDGDLGQPNLFVPLAPEIYRRKVDCLMQAFPSQQSKNWFREETFLSLMRLRGMECNSASGYAEAFYCRKIVL